MKQNRFNERASLVWRYKHGDNGSESPSSPAEHNFFKVPNRQLGNVFPKWRDTDESPHEVNFSSVSCGVQPV